LHAAAAAAVDNDCAVACSVTAVLSAPAAGFLPQVESQVLERYVDTVLFYSAELM